MNTICTLITGNRWGLGALVGVLALAGFASPASAQILYGAATGCEDCFEESSLYIIDPASGDWTLVGSIGFENVTGMAFVGDRLLATARDDDSPILIEIDPETGEGTSIDDVTGDDENDCRRMPDITYDPVTETLYAFGKNCDDDLDGLWSIDPETAVSTALIETIAGGGGNGLAIDVESGLVYATPASDGSLYFFDPDMSTMTKIPDTAGNVPNNVNALAFHPVTGILYGSNNHSSELFNLVIVDIADGTTTIVGETILGLDAIVFTDSTGTAVGAGVFQGDVCFVATAAYGTPMANDINVLRHFRDEVLLTSPLGTLFVDGYYRTSPPLANFVAQHPAAATTVRIALAPLLFLISSPWSVAAMALLLTGALVTRRRLRSARVRVK